MTSDISVTIDIIERDITSVGAEDITEPEPRSVSRQSPTLRVYTVVSDSRTVTGEVTDIIESLSNYK